MIKVKDGYAKLIGTTFEGSANRVLLSNGGDFEIHTGRNNEANKLVRTDASGYIQSGWINTTSGNFTGTPNRIYASNDGYIRYMTPANFFSTLTNSSNKLSITIGGQNRTLTIAYATNADTVDGLHASSFLKSNLNNIELNSSGSLKSYGGFIDFHYHDSDGNRINSSGEITTDTVDYTSRIIEDAVGQISINGAKIKGGKITGTLIGNADSATKATQDGDGNTISNTYLKLSGGTMSGNIIFPSNKGIVQNQGSSSNYTTALKWLQGGTSEATYDPQIGHHNTGDTDGAIVLVPYSTDTAPWGGSVGLYISNSRLLYKGNKIWHSGNDGADSALDADLLDGTHKSGLLTALASNASSNLSITIGGTTKSVTNAYSSFLRVHDVRGTDHLPNATTYYPDRHITGWFNSTGTPDSSWYSGITIRGWTENYAVWQLASYSSTGTNNNYNLYFRNGNTSWGSWKTILDSSNSKVSGGGSSWGSSMTVNLGGSSVTLTIPSAPTNVSGYAGHLKNTSVSDPASAASGQYLKWYSQISEVLDYAGNNYGFPASNNANGILWMGTHSGPYGGQLGISSNGNIYYRFISNNSFPTTANGGSWKKIAYTSDIPTSLKNPNALTIFGVSYDGSSAKTVTAATMIGTLVEGTSVITDNTEILTSYASNNGFADTNAPNVVYKRDAIRVYDYIKGKLDSVYAPKSHTHKYAGSSTAGGAATTANALASTGFGSTSLTYYQTSGDFYDNTGWSHYIIANHGSGETYYNYVIALPFWDVPKYKRQTGDTDSTKGWYEFITEENISSQTVSVSNKLGTSTVGGTYQPIYLSSGTATAATSYAKAIKSISRSGTTFTYTCLDGTTGTFSQQDNNTTYDVKINTSCTFTPANEEIANDTLNSSFLTAGFSAFRGSWNYAGNGYTTTSSWGNIDLAGTTIIKVGGSSSAYTQLFITPNTSSGTSSPLKGEMLYYIDNGDNYSPTWYRVLTNANYTSFINTTNFPGVNKTGTVTSVATGTGLTGGTITTSGTISINSTYQTYIANGNTAYGWGNHAGKYIPLGAGFSSLGDFLKWDGTTNFGLREWATSTSNRPTDYGTVLDFKDPGTTWYYRLAFTTGGPIKLYSGINTTTMTDKGTLAFTSQIPSVGNGTVTIYQNGTSMGSFTMNQSDNTTIELTDTNTDTNTHYTTRIYAGASGTAANAAATNPYVKITDDNTYRNQIQFKGSGATSVSSDANGVITISSTNSTYTLSSLGGISSVSASGTSPLTLSATKSGTSVSITGSIATYNPATFQSNGVAYISSGIMEFGYAIDFHSANNVSDYNVRLRTKSGETGNYTVTLPSAAGTLALTSQIPTKTSQLTNDSGFITSDTNYYPTTWAWSAGTTYGPTASLSGSGMSTITVAAIPSASSSASGIVTTGAQTFAGEKTFSSGAVISSTNKLYFNYSSNYTTNSNYVYGYSTTYLALNGYSGMYFGTGGTSRLTLTSSAFYPSSSNSTSTSGISLGSSSYRFTYGYFAASVYAYSGFYESSDERLKNILNPVKVNLDDLSKLRKIYYVWKDNPKEGRQLGMVAQDIQRLYPEIVTRDSETGYLSLAYDRLSVIALEAIDQVYNMIKDLRKENEKLKDRISKLEKLLK